MKKIKRNEITKRTIKKLIEFLNNENKKK